MFLRSGLLRYILHTCPELCNPCSKFCGVDCFGTYFTHVQSCVATHVQSCDAWNPCSKCYGMDCFRYILHTCPKLWCNPCSKCYGVDCFGAYFTHVQSCDAWNPCSKCYGMDSFGTYFTHVQSCDVTRVQIVPGNGLLRYTLHTCPKLWCNPCSKCYGVHCFGTYFTHVQSCDVTRVQSATEWTASVHTSHMSKAVM